MRSFRAFTCLVAFLSSYLLCSLTSSVAFAAANDLKKTTVTQLKPASPDTMQGEEGGFWRTDHSFDSVLRLKNVLLHQALEVTPAIYFADGTIYRLSPVHLEAAGTAQLNIRAELQLLPPTLSSHRSEFGMVGVEYKWSWPAVIATVQNMDEVLSLTGVSAANADITKVHSATEASALQVIRGAWWFQGSTSEAFLVLQNTAPSDKQVSILIADKTGAPILAKSIQLASHATSELKLSTLFEKPVVAGLHGSVTIRYEGVAHSILATGILEDDSTGYSATPHLIEQFVDSTQPIQSISLHAPGLMLGDTDPAMLFPSGTAFIPYGILQNVSARSLAVSITLTTESSDGAPKSVTVDTLTLAPGEVRKADFSRYFPKGTLPSRSFGNLTFTYQGRDGELQVDAGSIDASQSYVFEATPSLARATASRTFCFWSIEGDTDTMISVWNYLDTPQDLVLTLFYSGGLYKIPFHLDARKTYNLDLMKLVKSRVPDPDGNLVPSYITSGSGLISSRNGNIAEMSVAISVATYNVRTATCGNQCQTCNGVRALAITPNPANLNVGDTIQLYGEETLNTGDIWDVTSGSWSSSDPSASIDNNGVLTGVTAGTPTIQLNESSLPAPAGYVCTGPNGGCPPPISAYASGQANITPTISQNKSLWFFGSGIMQPSTFTLGATQATFTANGASGGTFNWTLSDGSKATFASDGSVSASTTTSSNTVQVYGEGFSTSLQDETITLTWTPSGGNPLTSTLSFTVDSPYKLTLFSITGPDAVDSCAPVFASGNSGWHTKYTWQMFSRFNNGLFGMSVNENFANQQDYQVNSWPIYMPNGNEGETGVSVFSDNYCAANQSSPASEAPQSPLTANAVDSATQYYSLGSSTVGSGVPVQTQLLTRYVDHPTITAIISPVR